MGTQPAGEARASGAAIARSAFHLVLGQVATTALAIAFSAAIGRRLGAAEFGVFYLVTTASTFAWVVAEWGQGQLLTREVARQPEAAETLLGAGIALRVGAAVPVSLASIAAGWLLGYDGRTLALLALAMATSLPFFVSQAYSSFFRARERMDLDARLSVLFKALTFAFAVVALLLRGGVGGIILAQGAAGAVALAYAIRASRSCGISRLAATRDAARALLRAGTPILAVGLSVTIQPYLDAIVLSRLLPAAPVGWYGAARNIMGTLVAPATILGAAAYPRLSRAAGDLAHFRLELRTAMRPLLGLGALGAVGTYLFADVAIGLIYGARGFGPAAAILQVFAPALFLVCVDVLFQSAVLAVDRGNALAAAKAVNVAVCTGLALLLVPWAQAGHGNGGLGLVAAFGASELIMFGAALWIMPRGSVERGFAGDIGRSILAGGLTLLVFRLLPPLHPALGIPACVAVFAAAAMGVGLVRREEAQAISAMLLRRRAAAAVEEPRP